MTSIYLDNNATTPLDPTVRKTMGDADERYFANPASQHQFGRQARSQIDVMTELILVQLGVSTGGMSDDELILTSGGTESNNLALRGLLPVGGHLLVPRTEHPSITATAEQLARENFTVSMLDVSSEGVVCLDGLEQQLAGATGASGVLVSVMFGNNETGVLQPVDEVARLCREFGAKFHTDAAQAVGKTAVSFSDLGADAMTFAPHKFHGPKGIGALLVKHAVNVTPFMFGGAQQYGIRPGTECPTLVAGMAKALQCAQRELDEREAHLRSLRDELESLVCASIDDVVVVGGNVARLPQTSCLAFPRVDRQALLMALDLRGLACSTGSACASGSSEPSPVLLAMGLPDDIVGGAIRLSVGQQNTEQEVRTAAEWIIEAVQALRSRSR